MNEDIQVIRFNLCEFIGPLYAYEGPIPEPDDFVSVSESTNTGDKDERKRVIERIY